MGIYVGGTGSANKLEDYEEGTFTPSLAYSTTNSNPTHTGQQGQYTKIGNLVTFQIRVNISNNGSGSGNVKINGLPFGVDASSISNAMVQANAVVGLDVGGDREIFVQFEGNNTTSVFFYTYAIESSSNYGVLSIGNIDNNLNINVRGTYFTSS